ncbi:Tetratricopeptide repeat protein [compost metagenome]
MSNTILKKLFTIIFILLVWPSAIYAKDKPLKGAIEFDKLNSLGEKAYKEGNNSEAIKNFTKAEFIAQKNNLIRHDIVAKFNIGKVYSQISNFGEALKYYLQALNIANKHVELKDVRLTILSNIGGLYENEKDYESALKYLKKAYTEAEEIKSSYNSFLSGINISDIYNHMDNYKEARVYLNEIKGISVSKELELVWYVNYAESFFVEGRIDKAQKIMEDVLKSVDSKNEKSCYLCVVNLLSKIYEKKNKLDKAIYYAKIGLENSHSIGDSIESYEMLSQLYFKKKDYDNAFKYKNLLLSEKDSLSASMNRSLFETNKAKLKIKDYQAEVKHHQEKQKAERDLFIIIIILCLCMFFFIYRSLRNRLIKQKQEKIITENIQKIADLEMENLNNNIAEKNRKLSANALYLSGRNELIEEIIDSLSDVPAINLNPNATSTIKNLKNHLKVDDEWDDFITYFEQVNPDFLKALQNEHFQFTASEIRFICYMYMNLDMKEISAIFNITIEAAKKRKQRIAKKLDIDMDAMYEHLLKMA